MPVPPASTIFHLYHDLALPLDPLAPSSPPILATQLARTTLPAHLRDSICAEMVYTRRV